MALSHLCLRYSTSSENLPHFPHFPWSSGSSSHIVEPSYQGKKVPLWPSSFCCLYLSRRMLKEQFIPAVAAAYLLFVFDAPEARAAATQVPLFSSSGKSFRLILLGPLGPSAHECGLAVALLSPVPPIPDHLAALSPWPPLLAP